MRNNVFSVHLVTSHNKIRFLAKLNFSAKSSFWIDKLMNILDWLVHTNIRPGLKGRRLSRTRFSMSKSHFQSTVRINFFLRRNNNGPLMFHESWTIQRSPWTQTGHFDLDNWINIYHKITLIFSRNHSTGSI